MNESGPTTAPVGTVWSETSEIVGGVFPGGRPSEKVNRTAGVTADVPYPKKTDRPRVSVRAVPDYTRTSTVPTGWAGATATARVSDRTVTAVASTPPKRTCNSPAAPEKF